MASQSKLVEMMSYIEAALTGQAAAIGATTGASTRATQALSRALRRPTIIDDAFATMGSAQQQFGFRTATSTVAQAGAAAQ